ncbi:MAG TPA: YfhO family protein [bacterium]|nr:YfhO family protein [bacterium]
MKKIFFILLILILILLPLYRLFTFKKVWAGSDLIQFFFYNFDFTRKSILANDFPLWNPFLFSGYPWFAAIQNGLLYPINYIIILTNTEFALNLIIIIHFILGYIGAFLLINFYIKNIFISVISAFIFIFNGFVVTHFNYGHLTLLELYFLLPLGIYSFIYIIENISFKFFIFFIFIVSFMFLAGHPQIFFYFLFTIFILLLFNFKRINNYKKFFLLLSLSLVLIIILILPQLSATFELTKNSARITDINYKFNTYFSLEPLHIVQIIAPNFFGNCKEGTYWRNAVWRKLTGFEDYRFFIGFISLFFVLICFLKVRDKKFFPFKFLFIIALFIAFGKYTPVYKLFYYFVPGFKLFRWPVRFMAIFHIANIVLTAAGINYFFEKSLKFNYKFLLYLIVFFSISLICLFIIKSSNYYIFENFLLNKKINFFEFAKRFNILTSTIQFSIIKLIFIISFFTVILSLKISKQYKLYFLLFLIYFELVSFSITFFQVDDMKKYINDGYKFLVQNTYKTERILSLSKMEHLACYHSLGISSIKGYEPLIYNKYANYLSFIEREKGLSENIRFYFPDYEHILFKFLNVKYIIDFENKIWSNNFVFNKDNIRIIENQNRFGFWKIYDKFEKINFDNFFNIDFYKLENTLFLETDYNFNNYNFSITNNSLNFNLLNFSNNLISFNFSATQDCLLLLSVINYPGWQVYDNGKKINHFSGNYLFISFPIKKGEHKIILKFTPTNFYFFLTLSGLTFVFLCFIFLILIIIEVKKYVSCYTNENKKNKK